jgi:stage II sporulation protein D
MLRPVSLIALLCAAPAFAVETMRIAMGEATGEVTVSASALAWGADAEEAVFTALPTGRVVVRMGKTGLELDGQPVGDTLRIRVENAPEGVVESPPIRAGSFEVRGDVVVRVTRGGKLQLINVIPLEEYLVAVLGSEMPSWFPDDALRAQAIAARTYALQRKLETYGQPFHMGSGVLDQVYGGLKREDPRAKAAVLATRGEVLTYQLLPVEAYFHSSCGGRTASGTEALGRDLPYLKPVDCPCGRKGRPWQVVLGLSDLKAAGLSDPSTVRVAARTPTGRVQRLASRSGMLDGVSFRRRIGYEKVKSLAFNVEQNRGEVKITGRGFGHGAGMCQWGAEGLAEEGWAYRRILEHYYPGAEIQRLY